MIRTELEQDETEAGSLYRRAASIARSGESHKGAPGSHELPFGHPVYPEGCPGRLRTAYIREAAPNAGPNYRRSRWVPIGIVCAGCLVLWAGYPREAAPDA